MPLDGSERVDERSRFASGQLSVALPASLRATDTGASVASRSSAAIPALRMRRVSGALGSGVCGGVRRSVFR
jgi:hypothetical protein